MNKVKISTQYKIKYPVGVCLFVETDLENRWTNFYAVFTHSLEHFSRKV